MLWSYSEVLAYINEGDDEQVGFNKQTEPSCSNTSWSDPGHDFILIAENSEIHGPNPLFTIPPPHYLEKDLTLLSTHILSADYQGLSNNKCIGKKNTQLLMPDIKADTHAAINHFILFDSQARGFVRPLCLAYVTSDRNKLIELSKLILENLNKACSFIQHSNIKYSKADLKNILESLNLKKNVSNEEEISKDHLKYQDNKNAFAQAIFKDVQDILDVIEKFEILGDKENQICMFLNYLRENTISETLKDFLCHFSLSKKPDSEEPSANFIKKKYLKSLLSISPGGMILGLYHLYNMYKYFRRKYENIKLIEDKVNYSADILHFGTCIKKAYWDVFGNLIRGSCLYTKFTDSYILLEQPEILNFPDIKFEELLLNFLSWDNRSQQNLLFEPISDFSFTTTIQHMSSNSENDASLNEHKENEWTEISLPHNIKPCRHNASVITLWESLNFLENENPDIESTFLQVLKIFGDIETLLFSLLIKTPIVLICSYEELVPAENFMKVLSIFMPFPHADVIILEVYKPLHKEDLHNVSGALLCLKDPQVTPDNVLPSEIMASICILNMKNGSCRGPKYSGHLLTGRNFTENPFPILVEFLIL